MAENNSNVTIFAILILAVLVIGAAYFYLRDGGEDVLPATTTEPAATAEQPASEPEAQEDEGSDFSLEFEDEEGNNTTIQGDGDSE